jgi:hypothetical protein
MYQGGMNEMKSQWGCVSRDATILWGGVGWQSFGMEAEVTRHLCGMFASVRTRAWWRRKHRDNHRHLTV